MGRTSTTAGREVPPGGRVLEPVSIGRDRRCEAHRARVRAMDGARTSRTLSCDRAELIGEIAA